MDKQIGNLEKLSISHISICKIIISPI